MIRRYNATTHLGGVTEMVRLSQGVNASTINPSSPVSKGENFHTHRTNFLTTARKEAYHEEDLSFAAGAKMMIALLR